MKTNNTPSRSQFAVLRQICNLIPSYLTPTLARECGVDKKARTYSPRSHLVSLIYAQLTHAIGLNDICDALRLHSGLLVTLRAATAPLVATTFLTPTRNARPFLPKSFSGRCSAICKPSSLVLLAATGARESPALVSSAGHGKADVKRLHYQEGKFALATTMCALLSKDEKEVIPRYLFILLSRLRYQLLVPLMCGATNVTMSSSQLLNLVIPVPKPEIQKEIIEIHLAEEHATQIEQIALSLKRCSTNPEFLRLAKEVFQSAEALLNSAAKKTHVDSILAQEDGHK